MYPLFSLWSFSILGFFHVKICHCECDFLSPFSPFLLLCLWAEVLFLGYFSYHNLLTKQLGIYHDYKNMYITMVIWLHFHSKIGRGINNPRNLLYSAFTCWLCTNSAIPFFFPSHQKLDLGFDTFWCYPDVPYMEYSELLSGFSP